jgi:hypothetical protein
VIAPAAGKSLVPSGFRLLGELDRVRIFYATGPLARHRAPEGLVTLRRLIIDAEPTVRVQAASQLLESGDMSAQSALLKSLPDGGTTASLAFQALVKWGNVSLPELCGKLLGQPDPGLAWVVAQVLSVREGAEAADILTRMLDDERPFVRALAAELLLAREEASVISALKHHLDGMLQETTSPADPRRPAPVRPPADSAYQFIKRHLTPAGTLPD